MNNKIFTIPVIRGISAVIPKERIALVDLAANFNMNEVSLKNIINLSGIREIRQTAPDETISDLCVCAAKHLLDELNFDKSQIDAVVFVTPCPDYIQPGPAYLVHNQLNLSPNCLVFDFNHACVGYVNAMFQAFLMIQSGYCKNVLLCSGDTPTKSIHPKDKSLRMVQGDAGSATLISTGENSQSAFDFYVDSTNYKALYIPAGGSRMPHKVGVTDVEIEDEQGNIRTLENAYMNGLDVMAFAVGAVPKSVKKVLSLIDWNKDDVGIFAFHQANKFMVDFIGKKLRVPLYRSPLAHPDSHLRGSFLLHRLHACSGVCVPILQ